MTLLSAILGRRWGLPRAQTSAVVRERELPVEMDDGAVLLADRWVAEAARDVPQPTVLVRSCYGRGGFFGLLHGRLLAERGLQVVIQSVRGTFGSEGTFNPFDERADGLATLAWLRRQPWHAGPIGMTGQSYLGLVQWAVAADADEDLAALVIQGSASQFHGQSFPGGSLAIETSAQWLRNGWVTRRRAPPRSTLRTFPPNVSSSSLIGRSVRLQVANWWPISSTAPPKTPSHHRKKPRDYRHPRVARGFESHPPHSAIVHSSWSVLATANSDVRQRTESRFGTWLRSRW